ncbi:MAG: YtxH-like protein [Chloroflexi bacterium OLB15]|nr:MAG: YtxH-like protein [Chloroflexi bacterium OLB15]
MNNNSSELDWGFLVRGLILGFLVGGAIALFTAPVSGKPLREKLKQRLTFLDRDLREHAERLKSPDPVSKSLMEGQAAAHKRLEDRALAR